MRQGKREREGEGKEGEGREGGGRQRERERGGRRERGRVHLSILEKANRSIRPKRKL